MSPRSNTAEKEGSKARSVHLSLLVRKNLCDAKSHRPHCRVDHMAGDHCRSFQYGEKGDPAKMTDTKMAFLSRIPAPANTFEPTSGASGLSQAPSKRQAELLAARRTVVRRCHCWVAWRRSGQRGVDCELEAGAARRRRKAAGRRWAAI